MRAMRIVVGVLPILSVAWLVYTLNTQRLLGIFADNFGIAFAPVVASLALCVAVFLRRPGRVRQVGAAFVLLGLACYGVGQIGLDQPVPNYPMLEPAHVYGFVGVASAMWIVLSGLALLLFPPLFRLSLGRRSG